MTPEADDLPDVPVGLEDLETSPLREMVAETHEVYEELLAVGFEPRVASQIVAHILYDGMISRFLLDDDDEDFEEDDDSDEHSQ